MGTDIHMIGEHKDWQGNWVPFPIPDKFTGRYYKFFAALADVRNGHGFAGIYTHEEVKPLTSHRGWPDDMSPLAKRWCLEEMPEDDPLEDVFGYPGDHSAGYATLAELREYDFGQVIIAGGVVSRGEYNAWDKQGHPGSWSGDVGGGSVQVVTEEEYTKGQFDPEKDIYIRCQWEQPLVDPAFIDDFLQFLDYWRDGQDEAGDSVRIIFNFDS